MPSALVLKLFLRLLNSKQFLRPLLLSSGGLLLHMLLWFARSKGGGWSFPHSR